MTGQIYFSLLLLFNTTTEILDMNRHKKAKQLEGGTSGLVRATPRSQGGFVLVACAALSCATHSRHGAEVSQLAPQKQVTATRQRKHSGWGSC